MKQEESLIKRWHFPVPATFHVQSQQQWTMDRWQGRRAILDYGELLDNAFGPLVKLAWKPRGKQAKQGGETLARLKIFIRKIRNISWSSLKGYQSAMMTYHDHGGRSNCQWVSIVWPNLDMKLAMRKRFLQLLIMLDINLLGSSWISVFFPHFFTWLERSPLISSNGWRSIFFDFQPCFWTRFEYLKVNRN